MLPTSLVYTNALTACTQHRAWGVVKAVCLLCSLSLRNIAGVMLTPAYALLGNCSSRMPVSRVWQRCGVAWCITVLAWPLCGKC
ncbi:hypothetical protein M3J09_005567 [Ascochyta lentis]